MMTENGSLKRDASDDEMRESEGPAKRAKFEQCDVDTRFLIPSKYAGAIIGRRGSNIKKLRSQFKASVGVPDSTGPERILSITTDVYNLGEILRDIVPKLNDVSPRGSKKSECELRMLVHQSHAGSLIGRGGSKIKELRKKTGTQIKIFSSCCPGSTERIVQIIGTSGVIVDCVKEICTIINETPIKGPNRLYDPYNCVPPVEHGEYEDTLLRGRNRGSMHDGRMAIPTWKGDIMESFPFGQSDRGQSGFMDQGGWKLMDDFGAYADRGILGRPGWDEDIDSYGSPANRNRGLGRNILAFMGQGRSSLVRSGTAMQRYSGNRLNGRSRRKRLRQKNYLEPIDGCGELFSAKPVFESPGVSSIKMKIPNDVVDAITGENGKSLRKIRRDTSAKITIGETMFDTDDRIVTIVGPTKQVTSAHYRMKQRVHDQVNDSELPTSVNGD